MYYILNADEAGPSNLGIVLSKDGSLESAVARCANLS